MSGDAAFVVKFLIVALAVYRLAELLVFDDGPAGLVLRLRGWTGMYDRDEYGANYAHAHRAQRAAGKLLECPYCVGVWLAFAGMLVLFFVDSAGGGLVVWALVVAFALAGAQSALETAAGRAGE